jgi:hypothetical protein
MKSREIAGVLEIPPATVDTRVARARKMLRELLRHNGDAENSNVVAETRPMDASDERAHRELNHDGVAQGSVDLTRG